jgi:hypothetical protein
MVFRFLSILIISWLHGVIAQKSKPILELVLEPILELELEQWQALDNESLRG